MTAMKASLLLVNTTRRVELGLVLGMVAGGLGLAAAGAVASVAGVQLPAGVAGALAVAGAVLGWGRILIAAAVLYGVVTAAEDC
jgi:hypothetical protein